VFANFCANYFAKNIFIAREKNFYSDLACFALLTFCYNFPFQHFLLELCANVCKMCAKNFCDYVQNCFCNLFGIAFYFAISPFSFYKLLMLLWNSFANSWDLYFLKGIVELERYEAWNLALQINDATLSNVVARRSAEPRIQWSHFIFRLQLISNL